MSEAVIRSVRTIYGAALTAALYHDVDYDILSSTTLNEHLEINDTATLNPGERPSGKYFCIGDGATIVTTGANNSIKLSARDHRATDAAPFNILPLVLRRQDNDLTPTQQQQFACKKTYTKDNVDYFAYYLGRYDKPTAGFNYTVESVRNGVVSDTPFVPDSTNLNPTIPDLPATGTIPVGDKDYVKVVLPFQLPFNSFLLSELSNVANVIYGDPEQLLLSEVGFCHGVDRTLQAPTVGGGTTSMNEAVGVQVSTWVSGIWALPYMSTLDFSSYAGNSELLPIEV